MAIEAKMALDRNFIDVSGQILSPGKVDQQKIQESSLEAIENSEELMAKDEIKDDSSPTANIHLDLEQQQQATARQTTVQDTITSGKREQKQLIPRIQKYNQLKQKRSLRVIQEHQEIKKSFCSRSEKLEYINQVDIDRYIDNFWLMKCPDSLTLWQLDDAVKRFISTLLKTRPQEASENQTKETTDVLQDIYERKTIKRNQTFSMQIPHLNMKKIHDQSFRKQRSHSETRRVAKLYDLKKSPIDFQSIKRLGIGADITRPEQLSKQTTVTHKLRDFRKDQKPQEVVQVVNNLDLLITPQAILKHERQIDAIMISLKPTIYSLYFTKISKDQLKEYFKKIRYEEQQRIEEEKERIRILEELKEAIREGKKADPALAAGAKRLFQRKRQDEKKSVWEYFSSKRNQKNNIKVGPN